MTDTKKLDSSRQLKALDQLGQAVTDIAKKTGLDNIEIYVAIMFVAGGFAALNKLPLDSPLLFTSFDAGFDSFEAFNQAKYGTA